MPPIPIAASRLIAPVGIASTRTCGESAPIRMMAPLPQGFPPHEGDETPLPYDQVDVAVAHAKPVRHDMPPAGEEVLDRLLLPREPPLVPLVGPLRRVAAQAGLHDWKLHRHTATR